MSDVLDENGYHISDTNQLIASEKADKVAPQGLDENGYWVGISEKEVVVSEPKVSKPVEDVKPAKVSPKKK